MNMKTRLIPVVSAVAVSCLTLILSNTAVAQMKEGTSYQQQNPKGPDSSKVSKQGARWDRCRNADHSARRREKVSGDEGKISDGRKRSP